MLIAIEHAKKRDRKLDCCGPNVVLGRSIRRQQQQEAVDQKQSKFEKICMISTVHLPQINGRPSFRNVGNEIRRWHNFQPSSITANQAAIIALFRVINQYVGNLPSPWDMDDVQTVIAVPNQSRFRGPELRGRHLLQHSTCGRDRLGGTS